MSIVTNFQNKAQGLVQTFETLWKLPSYKLTTGSDTEYVQRPNQPNLMITTQIALSQAKDDCIVLEHPTLGLGKLPNWSGTSIISTILGWDEVEPQEHQGYLVWENLMFFAPSDLLAGLFNDKKLCRTIQRYCKQDARIRLETNEKQHKSLLKLPVFLDSPYGVLQVVLKVLDLGKLSVGGLAQNVEAFGGKMLDKSKMDCYKTNMLEPYMSQDLELFQDYLDYAKDDASQLFFLREANQNRTEMLFKEHGLEVPEREIVTTGSLVAELFQAYLDSYIGDYKAYELFEVSSLKGNSRKWTLEDLLTKATVKYFAERKDSKKAAMALVQGGRAKNELPQVIKQEGVIADIDLSGAYVTIQRSLTYAVGLPVTYGQHESSKKKLTLGQFLKKHEANLLPRLWSLVVTGKLNHKQTLVPSKVIETVDISSKYSEDDPKIPADFRLYTSEIINGVITSDVLETLRNVCSAQELKQWMDLEVIAGAWYPQDLRCNTPQEWYEKTLAHKEQFGNAVEETTLAKGRTAIIDNRSRYWLAVPLEGFLAPYASKRKTLKTEMKKHPKGSPEYTSLDAQQNAMKLVGNTNYGVLASPYFPVGNVVIANNITAAARVAVWLTAIALGCTQTITDGGAYDLNNVRTWKKYKPNLNTLSLVRKPGLITRREDRFNLTTKPLAYDTPWDVVGSKLVGNDAYTTIENQETTIEAKESGWQYLDQKALEHVKDFFKDPENPLTILDVISYEHKDIYVQAVYQSQTNYRFLHATGVMKTKARGYKVKGKPYENNEASNIHTLFAELDQDPTQITPYAPQYISQVLKCNEANEMLESKQDNVYKQNDLLAGDSILKRSWLRPLSLSMFHWQTDEQYQSWENSVNKLKDKTGWGLEQYFLNDNGTVNYQQAVHDIQEAIDQGNDWLFPYGHKGHIKERIAAIHPYQSK